MIAGDYEEALAYWKKAQKIAPDNMWPYFWQASIYGQLGREVDARAAAKELLRTDPNFSVERWVKWPGFKNREKYDLILDGLRKAGLK